MIEKEKSFLCFVIVVLAVSFIISAVLLFEVERLNLKACRLSATIDYLIRKTAPLDYIEKKDWEVRK